MSELWISRFDFDRLKPRSRQSFTLNLGGNAADPSLQIPVNVVSGDGAHPCLLCIAAIHGDETNGVDALMDVWAALEPTRLTGRLIMVPIANPGAYKAHQRRNPVDNTDLNRVFPGDETGTVTERLAAGLHANLVTPDIDFVFSMHSWYAFGRVTPYVEIAALTSPVAERSYRAAVASGFELVRASGWRNGVFSGCVTAAGIPAMEAEIGGLGISEGCARTRYVERVWALMRHLGMLPDGTESPRPVTLVEHLDIVSAAAGMLRMHVNCGEQVQANTLLTTISDGFGATRQLIRAPCGSIVGAVRMTSSVKANDHLLRLFTQTQNPFERD